VFAQLVLNTESKYITICVASMLQGMITGVPLLFFLQDMPKAYYLVFVMLCFIVCMVLLLVIFLPKMVSTKKFLRFSTKTQGRYISEAIRKSAENSSCSRHLSMERTSGSQNQDDSRFTSFGSNSSSHRRSLTQPTVWEGVDTLGISAHTLPGVSKVEHSPSTDDNIPENEEKGAAINTLVGQDGSESEEKEEISNSPLERDESGEPTCEPVTNRLLDVRKVHFELETQGG
jgi:hypothetical protein